MIYRLFNKNKYVWRDFYIIYVLFRIFYVIYSIEIFCVIRQSDNIFLHAIFHETLILPRLFTLKIFIQNDNHLKTRASLYYLLVTDVLSPR